MQKIYGYKESDVTGLAEFLTNNPEKPLSKVFEEYAVSVGKAKGTVRNLYYALIKLCSDNVEFCNKYFNGNPPKAEHSKAFTPEQEDWLLQKVITEKNKGRSVRSVINQISNGNMKLALRYQNKYRSLLVSKPEKVSAMDKKVNERYCEPQKKEMISETQMLKLKKEINALVERISDKIKKENNYLKARNSYLQAENIRLNNLLYGESAQAKAVKYFSSPPSQNTVQ